MSEIHVMKFFAITTVLCCFLMPYVTATFWGDWGPVEFCPNGEYAVGFKLKTQQSQGDGDDTALNAIALKCSGGNWITSSQGVWGVWGREFNCQPGGRLTSFQLRVEPKQGDADDTAANDLKCFCLDSGPTLYGDGTSWGEWNEWTKTCTGSIVAIQTRVEKIQIGGDNTALNDVNFKCIE